MFIFFFWSSDFLFENINFTKFAGLRDRKNEIYSLSPFGGEILVLITLGEREYTSSTKD